jgi:hypothetical protein
VRDSVDSTAEAWIISSPRSRSTDFESRMARKFIASIPFDSAGIIWTLAFVFLSLLILG